VLLVKEGKKVRKTFEKQYKIKKNERKKKSNKGITLTISDANTMEFIHMYVHP